MKMVVVYGGGKRLMNLLWWWRKFVVEFVRVEGRLLWWRSGGGNVGYGGEKKRNTWGKRKREKRENFYDFFLWILEKWLNVDFDLTLTHL
jgi:hypothetical protein